MRARWPRSVVRQALLGLLRTTPLVLVTGCGDLGGTRVGDGGMSDSALDGSYLGSQSGPTGDASADGPTDATTGDARRGPVDASLAETTSDAGSDVASVAALDASLFGADADSFGDGGDDAASNEPPDASLPLSPDAAATTDAFFDSPQSVDPGGVDATVSVDATVRPDATMDSPCDSTPPAPDVGFDSGPESDAGEDAPVASPAAPWLLTLVLDPSLDTVGDAVKVTVFTSATLLDGTGLTWATAVLVNGNAQIPLLGVPSGDYFLNINNQPADLVPTRIDDPSIGVYQRVGQKLRDSRFGPSTIPAYRVRTWSQGQNETGFVYFADGTNEPGVQPYLLLTYATARAEIRVLGTGDSVVNLWGLSNPHPTDPSDSFDTWILKTNGASGHHSTSCASCGCHTDCAQKPVTYAADYQSGWCYTCHYGSTGSVAGFVDPEHFPVPNCTQVCTSDAGCITTLAASQATPRGLALDAENVYWANFDTGVIWTIPKSCGGSTIVVVSGNHPSSLALSNGNIYYNQWAMSSLGGGVYFAPIDGSQAPALAGMPEDYPTNLAVSATNVYSAANTTSIVRAPLTGGSSVTMATGQHVTAGVFVDSASVYFAGVGASATAGFIGSVPVTATGPVVPTQIATAQYLPVSVAKDSINAYWTTSDGAVRSVPLDGGTIVDLATGQGSLGPLATDGVNLYWAVTATTGTASIVKLPVAGNARPVTVVSGQNEPDTIVVDDTSVYWTDSAAGTVMMLSPK